MHGLDDAVPLAADTVNCPAFAQAGMVAINAAAWSGSDAAQSPVYKKSRMLAVHIAALFAADAAQWPACEESRMHDAVLSLLTQLIALLVRNQPGLQCMLLLCLLRIQLTALRGRVTHDPND